MRYYPLVMAYVCLSALLSLTGCASEQRGGPQVSGEVTLDGAPLDYGLIHFESADKAGVNAAAPIEQGKFTLPSGNGLTAGSYKVSVTSAQPPVTETDPNKAMELAARPAPPEKILPKYNIATTLTADLKTDAPNTLKFEVSTSK